jgi:hypothetical protein
MAVLASDDFNRANSANLGANWTNDTGPGNLWTISSNKALPANNLLDAASLYTGGGVVWPDDQYAQIAVSGLSSNVESGLGVALRCDAGFANLYRVVVDSSGSNNISIARVVGGVYSLRGSRTGSFPDGTVFRAEIQGTTIRVYANGVQVGADLVDAGGPSSGKAGLFFSSANFGAADNWAGGDFTTSSTTNPYPVRTSRETSW